MNTSSINIVREFIYLNKEEGFFLKSLADLFYRLKANYPKHLSEPDRLFDIINAITSNRLTIVVESNYIDKQYRDSYYTYFSQKYASYESNCIRLSIFDSTGFQDQKINFDDFYEKLELVRDSLIGAIVLRPLSIGNIGTTWMDPNKLKVKGYTQLCTVKLSICGRSFKLKSFPFCSQDNETMTCAETALHNIMQYYSRKYETYRAWMPNEILKSLERSNFQRVLPSGGVNEVSIGKTLVESHFYPRYYDQLSALDLKELAYFYVESGIPFILCLPQHVVICIGHGELDLETALHNIQNIATPTNCNATYPNDTYSVSVDANTEDKNKAFQLNTARLINDFIIMDDNSIPFELRNIDDLTLAYYEAKVPIQKESEDEESDEGCEVTPKNNSNLIVPNNIDSITIEYDSIIVPLSRRIFVDALKAKRILFNSILQNNYFLDVLRDIYDDSMWGLIPDNPLIWRMFLTKSNIYLDYRCQHDGLSMFKEYAYRTYPNFIWVIEIGTLNTLKNHTARVEVIIDATSSSVANAYGILSIRYAKHMVFTPDLYTGNPFDVEQINFEKLDKSILEQYNDNEEDAARQLSDMLEAQIEKHMLESVFRNLFDQEFDFIEDEFVIYKHNNLKEV